LKRLLAVFLILTFPLAGAPKRRAAGKPSFDTSTPAGWLVRNAAVLTSTELVPWSHDLEPLRALIGDATVVGLGDGTHGTHEFYTVKLRAIDFLVREMNFDVVAFEGSFPLFERINRYAQGGEGDPRALLNEAHDRLLYFFWNVEEMLGVIEWVRAYNLARGEKPPVAIAGFDIYDEDGGVAGVLSYLRQVDPAEAARAESEYACVLQKRRQDVACIQAAQSIYDRLLAGRDAYVAASGSPAYEDAVQYATVVTQYFGPIAGAGRDTEMARNALWVRQHRGASGKTILWAHQEHIGETETPILGGKSMGAHLAAALGGDYFSIGSLTAGSTYRYWQYNRTSNTWSATTGEFPQPVAGSYESFFATRGVKALLVPLDRDTPAWLAGPAAFRTAGTADFLTDRSDSLPAMLDAVIYIEGTTPTQLLQ
jgi:erythromycin esterase